ncbi:putative cytochrome P450 hydroxylase [Fulvivirga imtechensis AK7]|uniref:Putative cytochrome P450 hydroxylase n=1 Tax=Fulvivirga imtechensis AK7 TaxID=1237149 RepID=L8JM70_9BACT|nr:cytochrome P450 [Fulvivirga imtechensis]ELR68487.1 putative cytochrome P450 hydroxylase [Fulvivirga imtechensis AK7]
MHWNPLDSKNIANPYPLYKELRENAPVFKAHTGEWLITGYPEIRQILKDSQFLVGNKKEWLNKGITYFNQKDQDFSAIADAINTFILLINPPEHTKIRKLVMAAWDDRVVEKIIDENVSSLLKSLRGRKNFDAVNDFASHLPAMTIAQIMGIPPEDYVHLRDAGRDMIKAVDPYNTYKDFVVMTDAANHFISYFSSIIAAKTLHPGKDLISKIVVNNQKESPPLSASQLVSLCIFLFIAGEETTIGFVSTSLLNLHKNPEQRQWLTGHMQALPTAIEELLRYDGPVHLLGRIVGEDLEFEGHAMKKGEVATLCLASANRDARQFEQADRFLPQRTPNRHIAFGSGIHFCLGDWLAKKQATIALSRFLKAFPNYQLDMDQIEWNNNLSIRSLKKLMVQV